MLAAWLGGVSGCFADGTETRVIRTFSPAAPERLRSYGGPAITAVEDRDDGWLDVRVQRREATMVRPRTRIVDTQRTTSTGARSYLIAGGVVGGVALGGGLAATRTDNSGGAFVGDFVAPALGVASLLLFAKGTYLAAVTGDTRLRNESVYGVPPRDGDPTAPAPCTCHNFTQVSRMPLPIPELIPGEATTWSPGPAVVGADVSLVIEADGVEHRLSLGRTGENGKVHADVRGLFEARWPGWPRTRPAVERIARIEADDGATREIDLAAFPALGVEDNAAFVAAAPPEAPAPVDVMAGR